MSKINDDDYDNINSNNNKDNNNNDSFPLASRTETLLLGLQKVLWS